MPGHVKGILISRIQGEGAAGLQLGCKRTLVTIRYFSSRICRIAIESYVESRTPPSIIQPEIFIRFFETASDFEEMNRSNWTKSGLSSWYPSGVLFFSQKRRRLHKNEGCHFGRDLESSVALFGVESRS